MYDKLRKQDVAHEEAFRLTLAQHLVAPAFLYKIERPVPGTQQGPVTDWELASRLSYFLWSSQPDDELRQRRRRRASCATRDARGADAADAARRQGCGGWRPSSPASGCTSTTSTSSTRRASGTFPTFAELRGAMYEESIRFFTDLFQNDGSVLDILDADHTFLNEALAKHYGIPGVTGAEWRRVDGVKKFSRGGILAQATTLAKQSGASRTSPILRGNWVSEVLLGEKLPRPPKDVPQLPEDEAATEGLTVRQLVEKHASDPKCAVCHQRIDPYRLRAGRLRRDRPAAATRTSATGRSTRARRRWTARSSTASTACATTC